MSQTVLVLGAGELGMAVLEALTSHPSKQNTKFTVLLRQSSLDSANPERRKTVQRLKALDMAFEVADVVLAAKEELAELFGRYSAVVSCNGMGLPSGTQKKIAEAALEGEVKRFFPWQFGME
jgi:NAD(P)-dependent dehydrogenase (short-subunit alcohol dehydrogenase family)